MKEVNSVKDMVKNQLIEKLEKEVKDCMQYPALMNVDDWQKGLGVLLTGNEAKMILGELKKDDGAGIDNTDVQSL